jgi:hypothetical protein
VLRGLEARCTACGALRPPFALASRSVTLAGQPSRIGGTVAFVSGWVVLAVGLSIAAFLGLLLFSIWPHSLVALAFSGPIAVLTLLLGLSMVLSGRRLRRSGNLAQKKARIEAIRALAAHRNGALTASQVALALNLSEPESDAALTELAKDPDEGISLEVDDDGRIQFLFGIPEKRWRVLEEAAAEADRAAGVELDAEARANASRGRARNSGNGD